MKCCKCKCNCKQYIVLQDFWLNHIKLMKGQVISEPVSKRWIELRLIARYKPNIEIAKVEAQRIAQDTHTDKPLEVQNEVDESEVFVNAKTDESQEKPKRKRGRPHKSTVIVETPEKSEILLERMILKEVSDL